MAKLSKDDVLNLAKLAKIQLTADEISQYQNELSSIISYVEQLDSADVKGLEPTTQVTGLVNVDRADEINPVVAGETGLLDNAPATKNNFIKTKRIL